MIYTLLIRNADKEHRDKVHAALASFEEPEIDGDGASWAPGDQGGQDQMMNIIRGA